MSSDPIEVLSEQRAHLAVLGEVELVKALDAAIASLSAPKPPSVNDNAVAVNESAPVNDKCPKCGDQLDYDKFSDAVSIGCFYFDVHLTACPGCGHVDHDRTWVE